MTELQPVTVVLPPAEAHLVERVRELQLASKAANTVRAYRSDLADFATWCADHGRDPLPASPETVGLYLTALADGGAKWATIARRSSAISQMHKAAGLPSPTRDWGVHTLLRGIRRELGVAPSQKAPLRAQDLRRLITGLLDDLSGTRDRALLLVGHLGAFRRSELVALDVGDVAWQIEGLVIQIRRSKTDQEGEGAVKAIHRQPDPAACPVRTLQAWVETAGLTAGPLWRGVDRHGNLQPGRLSGRAVAEVVKRACGRAGLDPALYAGHSLRSGLATAAAEAKAPERAIMRQGGWTSERTVRRYIRAATAFDDNASGWVRV